MGGNYNEKMLEEFVEQMIADKGLELSDSEKIEEKDRLIEELNGLIEIETVKALPEDKAQELERMIDEKGDDLTENEVMAVVYGSQGEINNAIKNAMEEFRNKYLQGEGQ